jgi:pimeloyl-ACP methyl ester carboxylesterase
MTRRRSAVAVLVALLLALAIGPFLVPVAPLADTVPPRTLADDDSRFVTLDGIDVHYKTRGDAGTAILLLHGFGASVFTWQNVLEPLGRTHYAIAYDRPAFGLTERPLEWTGVNPYSGEGQVTLATGLLDALQVDKAVLVGNSAGGRVAVDVALAAPERVAGLVLVSPAVGLGGGGPFRFATPLLRTPQMTHLGPLVVRSIRDSGPDIMRRAWHRPERMTDAVMAGYTKPLRADHWDSALFELTRARRGADPTPRLAELAAVPTLLVTGDDDRIVPTARTLELARLIPNARLEVLEACGHVPQEECPDAFLGVLESFLTAMEVPR